MLNQLPKFITKRAKIVGRGIGSGKGGHTIGKGTKGHKTRSGYKEPRPGFEGGQMPLSRRLPKLKGFTRRYLKIKSSVTTITTENLNVFENGTVVDMKLLVAKKIAPSISRDLKVVLKGNLDKKLILEGIKVSQNVKQLIEKLGGEVK